MSVTERKFSIFFNFFKFSWSPHLEAIGGAASKVIFGLYVQPQRFHLYVNLRKPVQDSGQRHRMLCMITSCLCVSITFSIFLPLELSLSLTGGETEKVKQRKRHRHKKNLLHHIHFQLQVSSRRVIFSLYWISIASILKYLSQTLLLLLVLHLFYYLFTI